MRGIQFGPANERTIVDKFNPANRQASHAIRRRDCKRTGCDVVIFERRKGFLRSNLVNAMFENRSGRNCSNAHTSVRKPPLKWWQVAKAAINFAERQQPVNVERITDITSVRAKMVAR